MEDRNINILERLHDRRTRGPVSVTQTYPTELHSRFKMYRKIMGHLHSVYCVCFDQTGQYILTGSDDFLIKIWSARDCRLLKTLRGHSGEITDMSINYDNRLLASGGMDKIIRIWDLKTSKNLECLTSHSATITSIKFAPYNRYGDMRYLISTSNDGSIIFWSYNVKTLKFNKCRKFRERNRPGGKILCSSFSSGGSFLACGSSDSYIHIYGFHPDTGPYWLKEVNHHKDQVDSIQFAHNGFRFITGSQDGTAAIWSYKRGEWVPLCLDMSTEISPSSHSEDTNQNLSLNPDANERPKVVVVQWTRDDRYVLTSISSDSSIKAWDSRSGNLVYHLRGHRTPVYLLESHPIDPRIFISATHDGYLIIWDISCGKQIKCFHNNAYSDDTANGGADLASIYDIKYSPDGNLIAVTDSHGCMSVYGNAGSDIYQHVPEQLFFHTDYRALIRDSRHFALDEQTHQAPHLMPRPTLVDMNGDPYPQSMQRFVPEKTNLVIAPLDSLQLREMNEFIYYHSRDEDDEYLCEQAHLRPMEISDELDDDETEIDSDNTVIDSDTTIIDDSSSSIENNRRYNTRRRCNVLFMERSNNSNNRPSSRRQSARLRTRKRFRRY